MKEDLKKLQEENAFLREEVDRLKDELIRLVSRNIDLSERLEGDIELRRRTEVAREIMEGSNNGQSKQKTHRICDQIGQKDKSH